MPPPASIAARRVARNAAPTGCPRTGIPKAAKFISAAMRYTRALYRGAATGAGEMA